jgi:hypothetical protein
MNEKYKTKYNQKIKYLWDYLTRYLVMAIDIQNVAKEFEPLLIDGEIIESFKLIQVYVYVTNKRLILAEKQLVGTSRICPYSSIKKFSRKCWNSEHGCRINLVKSRY